jgi:hypothetical protein
MNDHRFSYPHVVPLMGVTISGHSSEQLEPIGPLSAAPTLKSPVRLAGVEAAPPLSLPTFVAA